MVTPFSVESIQVLVALESVHLCVSDLEEGVGSIAERAIAQENARSHEYIRVNILYAKFRLKVKT
jgi:hypothetical protein